jgi:hypothetical protein
MPQVNMIVPLGNLIPFSSRQLMPLAPHGSLQRSCFSATNLKNCPQIFKNSSISMMAEKRIHKKFQTLHLLAVKGDYTIALTF